MQDINRFLSRINRIYDNPKPIIDAATARVRSILE
jgi:hypothetical protein